MALIAPVVSSRGGVAAPSFASVEAGGDWFVNDGRVIAWIANGHISQARAAYAAIQAQVDGESAGLKSVNIAAGTAKLFGPFPPELYNDVDGYVQLTYSASGDGMTIGLLAIP